MRLSIRPLVDAGFLLRHAERGPVKLHPDCLVLTPLIERLERRWGEKGCRIATASHLGDWLLLADEIESDNPMLEVVRTRAVRCCDWQFEELKRQYDSQEDSNLALLAIAALDRPELPEILQQALQETPSGTTSAALEIVKSEPGSRWCEPIFRLLRRVNSNGNLPEPYIWMTCVAYLLRKGYQTETVCKQLRTCCGHTLGEAALIAMEFAPDAALALFRRALRSSIPCNRTAAAAVLAIIDSPWSRHEMTTVLQETDDQEMTAECRAALMASQNAEARKVVEEWERRNPHEAEPGRFITIQEISLRNRDRWLQFEMETLHDRVYPLRAWIPPSSKPRRWWSL